MSYSTDARVLTDLFRAQARVQPNAQAQVFGDRTTSYADFDRNTSRVANGLVAAGAAPQSRIGYLGKNSDFFFELLVGALKANVVLVAINWRLAPPEMAAILLDAGVEILFVGDRFSAVAAAIETHGYTARRHFGMDGAVHDWPGFADWRDAQPDIDPFLPIDPEDTAVQAYTSGTTGLPKGVELSHRNVLAFLADYSAGCLGGLSASDVVLTYMPVFHVAGMFIGIAALAFGCINVVMEEANVDEMLALIPRYGISVVFLVPAVILAVVQHPEARNANLRSIGRLAYGASPIAESTLLQAQSLLPNAELWQVYGATETAATGTTLPPALHKGPDARLRSCGRPYPGVEVRVVDPFGDPLPLGEVGEITIRAAAVMKGYWNQPDATRAAFFNLLTRQPQPT